MAERTPLACPGCGSTFTPKRKDSTTCSRRCWYVARGLLLPEPIAPRTCALPSCDKTFQPRRKMERCCCEDHGRKFWKVANPEKVKAARQPWDDKRRDAYHRRRALKKGASTGEPVIFADIATRDRWTCHLCATRVDPSTAYPDPMSGSLDHVVPLSRGGLHDPSNVRLAHLRCNVAKGNRAAGDQLLLFG